MDNIIPDSELIINKDGSIYHLNLKPEHLATSVIAVGDPDRVPRISRYFDKIELKISNREFVTHTGTYKGKRLTVISSGMGTDNIDILMTELDALVNVDFKSKKPKKQFTCLNIIRVGTSGSLQPDIDPGELLVSRYGIGLDTLMSFYRLDCSELELEVGYAVQQALSLSFRPYCVQGSSSLWERFSKDMVMGNTVTCPGFFGPQGREVRIKPAIPDIIERLGRVQIKDFVITNFEMETAGYYALGRLLGHEVLSLNAIVANRVTGKIVQNPNQMMEKLIVHTLDNI
jgi:uridine phosphorylase